VQSFRTVLKNTFAILFSNFFSKIVLFFPTIYLGRVLGPENFGIINYGFALLSYLTLFSNFGIGTIGTRTISVSPEKASQIIVNFTVFRLCISIVLFMFFSLILWLLPIPQSKRTLFLVFGSTVIIQAFQMDWVFQGFERMDIIGFSQSISALVNAVLICSFIKENDQAILVPVFFMGSLLLGNLIMLLKLRGLKSNWDLSIDSALIKPYLKAMGKVGGSLLMINILYNSDSLLLGVFRNDFEVGIYSAAYKLLLFLIAGIGAYHDAIFPLISRASKAPQEVLTELGRITQKLMAIICFPVAMGGILIARPLFVLIFGEAFTLSSEVFQILIWAFTIVCLNTFYSSTLLACERESLYFLGVAVPAVVNLSSNFVAIPVFGFWGAACTTVLAELVGFGVVYHNFQKISHVPLLPFVGKPFISSVGMFFFGLAIHFLFPLVPLVNFFLSALVYFFLLIILKELSLQDFKVLRDLLFQRKLSSLDSNPKNLLL